MMTSVQSAKRVGFSPSINMWYALLVHSLLNLSVTFAKHSFRQLSVNVKTESIKNQLQFQWPMHFELIEKYFSVNLSDYLETSTNT